jgi:transposase
MKFQFVVGVDMSKEHFDCCLMSPDFKTILPGKVPNQEDKIHKFIAQLKAKLKQNNLEGLILVMEHTGIYTQVLSKIWLTYGGQLSIVPANKVSNLLGGKLKWAEKSDPLDAQRLAEFGIRYQDKLKLYQAPNTLLVRLQRLQRQRRRLLDAIKLLEVPVKESLQFDEPQISRQLFQNQQASIAALNQDLKTVEDQLAQLIASDPELDLLIKQITSVPGIGPVTAREIILATEGFTQFSPQQAKAFARYAGVVPLAHESGKMFRRRKTSKQANKKIRSLLTMCARSLIGTNSDLGHYHQRKIMEGKPSRLVINNMKNKLILRVFAVVRNQVMYQKNFNICLE